MTFLQERHNSYLIAVFSTEIANQRNLRFKYNLIYYKNAFWIYKLI